MWDKFTWGLVLTTFIIMAVLMVAYAGGLLYLGYELVQWIVGH